LLIPKLEWKIFTEVNYEKHLRPSRKDADPFNEIALNFLQLL